MLTAVSFEVCIKIGSIVVFLADGTETSLILKRTWHTLRPTHHLLANLYLINLSDSCTIISSCSYSSVSSLQHTRVPGAYCLGVFKNQDATTLLGGRYLTMAA